ncbi:MAG TPA: patatin-like phospholipase family protein [Burkholderiales bacterium]|nr:patatin-like phospholipase family protein [Burkholderiales bacterium]
MRFGPKFVNLALQGGGALGALTWGVLDRLLEEKQIGFEAISGASAGAMNAAVLASGFVRGGREGARESLDAFWNAIGTSRYGLPAPAGNVALLPGPSRLLVGLTRMFSPYQLNPFDINPLRNIVSRLVDFEALRSPGAIRLFVAATRVSTGALRVFGNAELTEDALLASACLPALHHAIEIDGEAYWDGGYSGNPPIYPLVYHCDCPSIVIVMLQPLRRQELPVSVEAIRNRLTEFQFNAPFQREMRNFALAREELQKEHLPLGRLARRLKGLDFHLIEADDLISRMQVEKSLNVDRAFLLKLRDEGRTRADAWLAAHGGQIGRASTLDLSAMFA